MNRFRIDDSFAIEDVGFVFVGEIVEGKATSGMIFEVTEAGHRCAMRVKSVEFIRMAEGDEKTGLVVDNPRPSYLRGLGVGFIAELKSER